VALHTELLQVVDLYKQVDEMVLLDAVVVECDELSQALLQEHSRMVELDIAK
jgi:hypothetical protein